MGSFLKPHPSLENWKNDQISHIPCFCLKLQRPLYFCWIILVYIFHPAGGVKPTRQGGEKKKSCLNVLTRHFSVCLTASGYHRAERRRGDPDRVNIIAGNRH